MENYADHFTKHIGYPHEWHKGNLRHRNMNDLIQFITFRLADSLPQSILQLIENEIRHLGKNRQDVIRRKEYQYYLDKAYIDNEVAYHEAVIAAVKDVLIPQTQNAELKALLVNVAPVLEHHLNMAKETQAEFK